MHYFPPEREHSALSPAELVLPIREALKTLEGVMRDYLRGSRFDCDPRYADVRAIEGFYLEQAVKAARDRLWEGGGRSSGLGRYPRCLLGLKRSWALLLTWEPFGGGPIGDEADPDFVGPPDILANLRVLSLATGENLHELTEILDDLTTWPESPNLIAPRRQPEPQAHSPASSSTPDAQGNDAKRPKAKRRGRTASVDKIGEALTILSARLKDGENLSIPSLVKQVRCETKNLKKSRRFMNEYKTLVQGGSRAIRHRGSKDEGTLEAWPNKDAGAYIDPRGDRDGEDRDI
jgi:hypothetical protein